jgi:KDO2-lipid IV(A) lauroyltransferase
LHSVYRHANNSLIDSYIQNNRKEKNAFFYKKGSESAKNMILALKKNHHLALLVDQRDSSGPLIDFMGKECFATDGYANLALKYKTKICPIYSRRINNDNFEIVIEKPLEFEDFSELNSKSIIEMVHENYFKKWILENPTQWLWVHQRWRM